MQRLLALALVLTAALLLAGCGDSKSEPDTTADWATGVCTAIDSWATSIKSTVGSATAGGLSQSLIESAVDDMDSATDTLQSDLEDLGKPDTQAGEQAKTSIDQLSSDLKTGADSIDAAVDDVSDISSAIAAAGTIGTTLTTMKSQITSTYTSLEQLDPKGELQTAFQQSSACTDLTNQLSKISTRLLPPN